MKNKNTIFVSLLILIIVGFAAVRFLYQKKSLQAINSYETCAAAGYPILETLPEQCKLPDGQTFTRVINANDTANATGTPPTASQASFGQAFTLRVGDKYILPDGTSIALASLNDSRCKPGVQCIWQGEIGAVFSVIPPGAAPHELRLGTVNNKSVTFLGHVFTLQGATPASATIIVSAKDPAPAATSGSVSGYIHIGPTCPVERNPPDPGCADRPYANTTVSMQRSGGGTTKAVTDAAGNFRVTLTPGTYTISVVKTGILPTCSSQQATIFAGQNTKVDISCDSGIR